MAGELAHALLRKGVGEMTTHRSACAACHRSPLPGELVHEVESGRALCALCIGERTPVASHMVHASTKRLVVGKMARAA
jgi:hypothetical protein